MLEHKRLAVRLRISPGEHFSAYLLRLAVANGISSVRELLATIGIKGAKASNHFSNDAFATLATYLGISIAEWQDRIARPGLLGKIPAHTDSRIYRILELPYPRICVTCIQNGSIIPAYAGQLPFTHCLEHGHELIHSCPQCHSQFEWSEELFECLCTACEAKLEHTESPPALPNYMAELLARQADTSSLNDYINDLLLAVQRVFEPLNSDLITRDKPPTEPMDWITLLTQAHSLLNDTDAISKWGASCSKHRFVTASIGRAAVYTPIDTLREKLHIRWPLHLVDCRPAGAISVTGTNSAQSHIQLAPVDHSSLSKMLGCKPAEILPLLAAEAITCIKGCGSVRDARFDLAVLAKQIERLSSDSAEGFISTEQAALIASAYGGHTGNVLAGILLTEIPFRPKLGRETLLDGAFVGSEGLVAYMAKHFASLESAHCTLLETIAITGLSERELSQACKLGLIKPLGWKSTLHFLGHDIGLLLNGYMSVRRWSKISGIQVSILRQHLDSQCFTACIDGTLYKRSPALETFIDSFVRR